MTESASFVITGNNSNKVKVGLHWGNGFNKKANQPNWTR